MLGLREVSSAIDHAVPAPSAGAARAMMRSTIARAASDSA